VTFGIAMDESGGRPWVYFGLLKAFLYCWGYMGLEYLVIIFFFGLGTAIIGKAKGSSFLIWFLVGAVLPILGLIAVVLYRREKDEPERQCPTCLKPVKLYVQVCPRCGTDLYLPDPRAVRHPGVHG